MTVVSPDLMQHQEGASQARDKCCHVIASSTLMLGNFDDLIFSSTTCKTHIAVRKARKFIRVLHEV